MVADLQLDSRRWLQEGRGSPHVKNAAGAKHPNKLPVKYQDSQTHQSRQYYGPSTPAVQTPEVSSVYSHPSSGSSYSREPAHPSYGGRQPPPVAYPNESDYTYGQPPPGYVQQGAYYIPVSATPGYQQPRTTPTAAYPYAPPSGGREPDPQYIDPRDPRAAYAYAQPPPATSSRHEAAYSPSRYFGYDGLVRFPPQR